MKSSSRFFCSLLLFLSALVSVSAEVARLYADNFRWGTPAQSYWFSHNSNSAGMPWERFGDGLHNNNGSAVNSTVLKSFSPVTLSQPGDFIRLKWEFYSYVTNDRQGLMEVGLFHLGAPFLANSVGTPQPITDRPGVALFQAFSMDSSYITRFAGNGTASTYHANFTNGRIDGRMHRLCDLLIEKTANGIRVTRSINGVLAPAYLLPGQTTMTFDAIRVFAPWGGTDNPRYNSIRNVELSVPEHLLPPPIWETYDWSQAAEVIPGVRHAKFSINNPRLMALNAVRIDLRNPNLRFYGTPRASEYIEGSRETLLRRTTDFVSDARAAGKPIALAMNGDFFQPVRSEGTPVNLIGVAFSDGVEVSPPRTDSTAPAFVFFKDWTADVIDVPSGSDTSNFLQAVGGSQFVLDGHVPTGSTSPTEPRTVAGVSIDRRYAFWLTVDGRRSGHSDGATIFELGELMRYFGAYAALNLDGGGSTTMVEWNTSTSAPQILNIPSDQSTFLGIPVGGSVERAVGNHLGVYAITEPEPIPAADWLAARGVPAGQRGMADDPNSDGISNLEAYAYNIHPMEPAFPYGREALPRWGWEGNELRYTIRCNRHATGLDFFFEYSTTLLPNQWSTLPGSATQFLGTPDARTGDSYFRTSIVPNQTKEFLRLRIEGP